jgi:WD40 repeat protein
MLNTKNDFELTPGPTDGASSLAFSPVADYLAASSWDGQVNAKECEYF